MQPASAPFTTSCNRRAASSTESGLPSSGALGAAYRWPDNRWRQVGPSNTNRLAQPAWPASEPAVSRQCRDAAGPGQLNASFGLAFKVEHRVAMRATGGVRGDHCAEEFVVFL